MVAENETHENAHGMRKKVASFVFLGIMAFSMICPSGLMQALAEDNAQEPARDQTAFSASVQPLEAKLHVYDSNTGGRIAGAIFKIQLENNDGTWGDYTPDGGATSQTTDSSGAAAWSSLAAGTYRLVETGAAEGYSILSAGKYDDVAGGVVTNTFTVDASEIVGHDLTALNSKPTAPTEDVTKGGGMSSADGTSVQPGDELTYSITYKNTVATSVDATITDAIPANCTFVSADNDGTNNNGTVTWNKSVDSSGSVTVSFTVKVNDSASGTTLTNAATVNDGHDDHATNTTTNPVPVVDVVKTLDKVDAATGRATYTITFTNDGPGDLPAGYTYEDTAKNLRYYTHDDSGITFSDGTLTLPALTEGRSASITITYDIVDTSAIIENRVKPENADYTLAEVRVDKNGDVATDAVNVGDEVYYRLTVTNNSDATMESVDVAGAVSPNMTLTAATGSGALANGKVSWVTGDIAGGGSASIVVTATVGSTGDGNVTNTAGTTDQTVVVTDRLPVVETAKEPNIEVSKSNDPGPDAKVSVGDQITYTITIKNTGKATSGEVVVTDVVPEGTTFASATDGGTCTDGMVTWNVGKVDADVTKTVTLIVDVAGTNDGSTICNTARYSVDGKSPVSTNTVENPRATSALVPLAKTNDPFQPGLVSVLATAGAAVTVLAMRRRRREER